MNRTSIYYIYKIRVYEFYKQNIWNQQICPFGKNDENCKQKSVNVTLSLLCCRCKVYQPTTNTCTLYTTLQLHGIDVAKFFQLPRVMFSKCLYTFNMIKTTLFGGHFHSNFLQAINSIKREKCFFKWQLLCMSSAIFDNVKKLDLCILIAICYSNRQLNL